MRIREHPDACFAESIDAPIVITGDFNDDPGFDYFEHPFLTHNVAGLIVGRPCAPRPMLPTPSLIA